ncbi:hypothetical protein ElyMa_001887500 [Elysia marginata]|uniref:Apple domain-containing protein n=1 Tax=Elysia marginata TaxID=1093978 RepID=A0AAV4EPK0_9GAST|nr:hypothetical protein ElyMa_001887500 [Elysia marginata]
MSAQKNCIWSSLLRSVLTVLPWCSYVQGDFIQIPGQKVKYNAEQLSSFSKPGMSHFLCAASCHRYSECNLYHFSSVSNTCAIFKQKYTFDPFVNLAYDPDWSLGYTQKLYNLTEVTASLTFSFFQYKFNLGR